MVGGVYHLPALQNQQRIVMSLRIWTVCLALVAWPVHAQEYRMPVEEPQNFVLEEALATMIQGAAEQMTGIPISDMTANAPDLFSLPEALVNSYGFDQGAFLVDVDIEGVKTRLAAAEIPLWTGPRPELLLWATEERGLERVMVGLEPHPVVDGILAAGERFALPIRRPLMDLEDTLGLSPAEIWGGFTGAIERASDRYGAEYVVVVGDRPDRQSLRFWLVQSGQEIVSREVPGDTPEMRVDALMRELLAYARSVQMTVPDPVRSEGPVVAPTEGVATQLPGRLQIVITYTDSVRLMALLDHVEADPMRARVRAIRLSDNMATIDLQTDLSLEAADRLISSFGQVTFVSPLSYALN